jgi:hypothetical protein
MIYAENQDHFRYVFLDRIVTAVRAKLTLLLLLKATPVFDTPGSATRRYAQ